MKNPLHPYDQIIDQALAQDDVYAANRLMAGYENASNKETFVAALVGRLLLEQARRRVSQETRPTAEEPIHDPAH